MATTPFALDDLPDEVEVEPLPRVALAWATNSDLFDGRRKRNRHAPPPGAPAYRSSTADSWDFQRVRVNGRQEMTCTECGETTNEPYCVRCGRPTRDGGIIATRTRMVPTLSYLQDGEFVLK